MWSQAIVFLASFSEISLASEEMRVMNSTQHSMRRSRASLAKMQPLEGGRISETIFWTVAGGVVSIVMAEGRVEEGLRTLWQAEVVVRWSVR